MKSFKDWVLGVDFIYPLLHGYLTIHDRFRSDRRPNHMGLDLCGKVDDEVLCCFPGKVTRKNESAPPGGTTIQITNDDEDTVATYSHLNKIAVFVGQKVSIGQVLGVLGAFPPDKPRPHVHFQLRFWGDPEPIMRIPERW